MLSTIESFVGSVWFGVAAFCAGLLLAPAIKDLLARLTRRG